MNTFRYVSNNPINLIDPYGLLSFHYHGRWGGPGMVNGQLHISGTGTVNGPGVPSGMQGWTEADNFPRQGDPGWLPPIDAEDWAYYEHDTCLNNCDGSYCDPASYSSCQAQCDHNLASNPNVPSHVRTFFRIHAQTR